jgi:hypothetical protein
VGEALGLKSEGKNREGSIAKSEKKRDLRTEQANPV